MKKEFKKMKIEKQTYKALLKRLIELDDDEENQKWYKREWGKL